MIVLNVVYSDRRIAAQVAKDLHRSRGWACWWLKRYYDEGIEGLKDRPKSGRHPKIAKQVEYKIKAILKESNHGWTTKQVEELIVEKSGGGIRYHYVHICRILHKWGFRRKVPRKVHVNIASKEEKEDFKKRSVIYLWISDTKKERVYPISEYESFIFYDSLVRRVWIDKDKRPIVRVTGSHKHSCLYGAISMEGKQLFRQYDKFNGDGYIS